MARIQRNLDALLAAGSRESLAYYLENVVINSSPDPMRFGAAADPWQRELIRPKIPAFEALAGIRKGYRGPRWFMDILARGHDKSSLEARLAAWCLKNSRRPINGLILAADKDQGRLIIDAMQEEKRHNPWAYEGLEIKRGEVTGPAGKVEVIPCDAGSAFGHRGNLFILDEIVHWANDDVGKAVVSGMGKVAGQVVCVLSNAGLLETWQHKWFLDAQADPKRWEVFYREGFLASWMDPEDIAALRKMLPPSEGDRLYDNRWIDPAEEFDYIRRYEAEACVDPFLCYRPRRMPNVRNYVASIDYGARRDRTALCVGHMTPARRVDTDRLDVWQGTPDDPVQIARVEQWIDEVVKNFAPVKWVVDPWQMEGTIQWMEKRGLPVERFNTRNGQGNYELAQHLRSLIVNRGLAWYPGAGQLGDETFVDELAHLRVKRMPYGFRFDHENQMHDDRAVAVGMMALYAVEFPPPGRATPSNGAEVKDKEPTIPGGFQRREQEPYK